MIIPDANFKNALLADNSINTNSDGEIQCYEAASYTGQIQVDGLSIADLTGIEAFVNITSLNCSNNQLTSLDVTANTALQQLNFSQNQLTTLDLSQNVLLDYLTCTENLLTALGLSNNSLLVYLLTGYNNISAIDLTNLRHFNIQNNPITSLDLSQNILLEDIVCSNTNLTALDVSGCPALSLLYCSNNSQLASLNLRNVAIVGALQATSLPSLSCIEVSDVSFANANWSSAIDPGTIFSLSCAPPGAALQFDGNNRVEVTDNPSLNLTAGVTIEGWLRMDTRTSYSVITMKSQPVTFAGGYGLVANVDNTSYQFYMDGWGSGLVETTTTINTGVWYHIAGIYDGSQVKIYVNGVLNATLNYSGPVNTSAENLFIGGDPGGYNFIGAIDNLRIWDRGLSQAEIQANMNCEITATGTGLLANYYFNQGQSGSDNTAITTLTDASGLGNDGSLVNLPLTGSTGNFIAPGGVVSGTTCAPLCQVADEPAVSSSATTICAGSNITLFITGGNLTITTANTCGSYQRMFTIRSVTAQPGGITGQASALCNGTNDAYSISPVAGATGYSWSVPAGSSIVTNAGTAITLKFGSTAGDVCVVANNACGASPSRCLVVTLVPAQPTAVSGPASVCKSSVQTYSVAPVSGASTYNWSVSGGASIAPQGTSANVNVNSALSGSATVRVSTGNACGFSPARSLAVSVNMACRTAGEPDQVSALTVFPNPARDRVRVQFSSSGESDYLLQVSDLLGKEVAIHRLIAGVGRNEFEIDLSGLERGVYLFSLS
jgi:hypothetical protein